MTRWQQRHWPVHIWTIHTQKIARWGLSYSKQSLLLFKYFSCFFTIFYFKIDLNVKCLNQLKLHSFNWIESIVKSINGIQGERQLIIYYCFVFISNPWKTSPIDHFVQTFVIWHPSEKLQMTQCIPDRSKFAPDLRL